MLNLYTLISDVYEDFLDKALFTTYLGLLKRHAQPVEALEIGCGTAKLSRMLAKRGYTMHALDDDEAMLTQASRLAYEEGLDITFLKHDILRGSPGRYALVLMPHDLLNHVDGSGLSRLSRHVSDSVLPGGLLIFDHLREQYLKNLVGHQETFDETEPFVWDVLPNERGALIHRIRRGEDTATLSAWYHSEARLIKSFPAFDVIGKAEDDIRNVVLMKKEK